MPGEEPAPVRLSASWTFEWLEDNQACSPGAVELRRWAVPDFRSLSMAFWERGLAPWHLEQLPAGEVVFALATYPQLDEVWTLWMMAALHGGRAWTPTWKALCKYADDVRQGFCPDRIPAERFAQRGGAYRRQTPLFLSLDHDRPVEGQFLFVPRPGNP